MMQRKRRRKIQRLSKKAVEDFMKTYYERVQKNDLENLKNMVEDTNELTEDQKAIHQYVKKYKNLTYLIKQGADDESYIVYVTYEMKIRKIKTLAPGMTSYYVMKKGNTFCIYNNQKHDTDEITDAKKEARHCLKLLKEQGIDPTDLDLPVAFDIEEEAVFQTGRRNVTAVTTTFCDEIKKAGFEPMVYSGASALRNYFEYSKIREYKI